MAFKRTLIERLFTVSKTANPTLTNCRVSTPSAAALAIYSSNRAEVAPDPGDDGLFRRFIQRRPIYQAAGKVPPPELRSMPAGVKLLEKLRSIDISRDRLRLDGLSPPAPRSGSTENKLTVEDARKLLKVSQLEMVRTKLRQIPKSYISYAEFVHICVEGCSDVDRGLEFAKMLDESGTVIVLGNLVFLRPDQEIETKRVKRSTFEMVLRAIQGLMPVPAAHPNDPRRKELEEMESQKADIDKKAASLVRREMWCGLGYLVVQTAAFMRLTFWELSWDVMEPICFYVTSIYFMACYGFFLRTSKEPSFEGFFQSRFGTKQKRLMKSHKFDIDRYNELRDAFYPKTSSAEHNVLSTPSFDSEEKVLGGASH